MKISVIGTGYVGLVSGACLAHHGHDVTCVDIDQAKVEAINAGRAPIHEEGLPELLSQVVGHSLSATTDLPAAIAATEITFIAVGTPAAEGRIDLKFVIGAAEQIGRAISNKREYHTVVVKSTVVPGTTDGPVLAALERTSGRKAGEGFGLGMNPEFLTEGQAIEDFSDPDRIVVGGIDSRSQDAIARVYDGFKNVPLIRTNTRTAEMIKYASNSALATLISFSNELSRLSAAIGGIDIADVMKGVHEATYFNMKDSSGRRLRAPISSFLEAGCGFGGSCLPKDVTALVGQGRELGVATPLLASVLEINRGQPDQLLGLVRQHYPSLAGVPVTVLGLAFKPGTDDLRESPAFPLLRALRAQGAVLAAFDPVARPDGHPDLEGVTLPATLEQAVQGADVIIHVTRWPEFQELGSMLHRLGRAPLVVDGRRNLPPGDFSRYEGIGRRSLS